MTAGPARPPEKFKIPAPGKYLNLNERLSPMARYRREQDWQQAAYIAACASLGRSPAARARPPATITLTLPFARNARRDPHNYVATVKPIVDGLVKAGVWPDDTPEYVRTVEPSLLVTRGTDLDVIVLLNYSTRGPA